MAIIPRLINYREKLKLAKLFLKPLLGFINIGLKGASKNKTPFRCAVLQMVKESILGCFPDYIIDFSKIILAKGTLTPPQIEGVNFSGNICEIIMTDNSGEGNAREDDATMLFFLNTTKDEYYYILNGHSRSTASGLYGLPESWIGDRVQVYIAMHSADGKLIATSEYLGEYIPA